MGDRRVPMIDPICETLELIQIPAGSFLMGSPEVEEGRQKCEGPQHEVTLESFFISRTPITQAQWREVAQWEPREGEQWGKALTPNPSYFQHPGEARLLNSEVSTHARPVEQVSWEDAMEFCSRLSQRTGRHYTLPSEAQWEYACRAGTTTPFAFGETITPELANYDGTVTYGNGPKGEYRRQTTPVGMFPANSWGLQDMHGNVWEWCLDHWHESYEGAPEDGSAWFSQEDGSRLLRGGSWLVYPRYCRSAIRGHGGPGLAVSLIGFRVVCLPQAAPAPAGDHALRDAALLALTTLEGWAEHGDWLWPVSALEQAKRNTTEAIASLETALSRLDHQTLALQVRLSRPPTTPTPAAGEVGELVKELEVAAVTVEGEGGNYEAAAVRRAAALLEQQHARIVELEQQLEVERMRVVCCGIVATSETPFSAAKNRACHPDYWSAAAEDVARQIDELIRLRDAAQLALTTLEGWANHDEWLWPVSALEQAKRNTEEAILALKKVTNPPHALPIPQEEP